MVYRSILEIPSSLRNGIAKVTSAESPWPLTLTGSVGTGKTCAALVLCDHVPDSRFYTVKELCDQVTACDRGEASWKGDGQTGVLTTRMFWEQIWRCPLVCLDELGLRDRVSGFVYDQLFHILDRRIGPTVVVSNLSLEDLGHVYDERIVSRLSAGTVLDITGPDRRLEARR